mgnify:CR=1 FL=1
MFENSEVYGNLHKNGSSISIDKMNIEELNKNLNDLNESKWSWLNSKMNIYLK